MKGSDNQFPKVLLEERLADGSDTATPAADHRALFMGEDGQLYQKDPAAAVTPIGVAGYAPGGTDVAVADGGTGASSASAARTNLGLVISTDVAAAVHASTHEAGGSDEIDVTGLTGAGGGGGATIQYPPLKPGTPTDDFNGASLGGGWSAWTKSGSFATSDCMTQAIDGSHLSMMFSAQRGGIYQSMSNVDIDLRVGGMMFLNAPMQTTYMPGICVLNSVGTGVALITYNDGQSYLASITTYDYAGILQTFTHSGHLASGNGIGNAPLWLRLQRVGNSWTGSISRSGRAWDFVSASSSVTITADRWGIGEFIATPNNGQLVAEWISI